MSTDRLGLSTLVSGQSQKEISVNMALQRLDAFVQMAVESVGLTNPPSGVGGSLYVVGIGAIGVWAGQDNNIAHFSSGAWCFYVPFEGMRLWDKETAAALVYQAGAWKLELTAHSKVGFFGAAPVTKTAVTLSSIDGEFAGLPISETYIQAQVQALRDKCEVLADDVRTLKAALSAYGLI